MSDGTFLSPAGVTTSNRIGSASATPRNYISPSTRRQAGFFTSPGPTPMSVASTMLSSVNDDEAEKRERRRSRVLDMQRRNITSPATPTDRRKSLPLSGLSNAQVTEHYTNCIKLSAENKINAKNAFGLHLIDYMSELIKKKEMTNFQVASSTLDASAKIYAGRVDAIHSQTYKLLTGLGRPAEGEKSADDGEECAMDEDGVPGADGDKKRKRARKSNTIETNLKNINVSKFDMEFEVDPLFKKTSAAFDEGGTGGLLLNHLRCLDDSSELVLDSNTVVYGAEEVLRDEQHGRDLVDLKELREKFIGVNLEPLQICPPFADFEFLKWNRDGEDMFKSMLNNLAKSDQAFDLDAEPETFASQESGIHDHETMGADDFIPGDDGDGDNMSDGGNEGLAADNDLVFGDGKEAQMAQTTMQNIKHGNVGQLMQVLASEPSEYSYFSTNLLRTWAGPEHWKLQPKSRDVNEQTKRTKVKKEPFKIEYEIEISFEKHFKETRAATTMTKQTLDRYSKSQTTLPEDLHYDADKLFRVFIKPKIMVRRQSTNREDDVDDNIDNYDYDNVNDRENFCPGIGGVDDDDDDNDGGFDFTENLSQEHTQGSFGNDTAISPSNSQKLNDSLIAQPKKVSKIDIGYAKTAKKMDVKRLKASMWSILNKPEKLAPKEKAADEPMEEGKEAESGPSTPESADGVVGDHSFASLVTVLPDKVSKNMAKNLSVPIAFVCLLHLANERNLVITSDESMADLHISQG